ncbi:MAG: YgaC family protein [Actinomycetota bacterium]|nr:YgaC family protein [Actinomycetota bacterium]
MAPGDLVRVCFLKWGGHPHWSGEGIVELGEDEHGRWLGVTPGTRWTRPGGEFATLGRQVMLVPPADRWFVATFYEPVAEYRWRIYVDITTPAELTDAVPSIVVPPDAVRTDVGRPGRLLTCVDLDLDVVQGFDGVVTVEDEDEFAAHQVQLGYPADVVGRADAECTRVAREVARGAAGFAEPTAALWRDRFADLNR